MGDCRQPTSVDQPQALLSPMWPYFCPETGRGVRFGQARSAGKRLISPHADVEVQISGWPLLFIGMGFWFIGSIVLTPMAPVVGALLSVAFTIIALLRFVRQYNAFRRARFKGNPPKAGMRTGPLIGLLQIITVLTMFPAFFCVVSFLSATSPIEASSTGQPFPNGWHGGVITHGSYYQWWQINDRPAMFAFALVTLLTCLIILLLTMLRHR